MKKIIFPAVLIGTILIGGVLGYSIWKASPQTAQEFVKSGKEYYEANKYSEAIIQFANALRKDPRDREARYLLALSYADQNDLGQAVNKLTTLLSYYTQHEAATL